MDVTVQQQKGKKGALHPDPKFGTRAVERIQTAQGFEHPTAQAQIQFLHEQGYTPFGVTAEKMIKDYIQMDDPEQATSRLGNFDGQLVPTMYFAAPPKKKGAKK